MTQKPATREVNHDRKALVEKIISNMEKGYVLTPQKWNKAALRPYNPTSNLCYRGINRLRLMDCAIEKGFTDPRWCTFNQAIQNGWSILPGEHGTRIEKWIWTETKTQQNPDTGEMEKIEIPLAQGYPMVYTVFNAQQMRGVPELETSYVTENNLNSVRDALIASSECPIQHAAQDKAFYSPTDDKILLPPEQYFKSQEAYIATLMHEMGHSTGHPERLNRSILNNFGTPDYAREELRAELSSAFLQSDLGLSISDSQLQDHSNYLVSWIEVLKNDPNELFRACKDAEIMSDRLYENYEKILNQENAMISESKILNEAVDINRDTIYFSILKNPDGNGFDLYKISSSGEIVNINEFAKENLDFDAAYYKLRAYASDPKYTYIEPVQLHTYANTIKQTLACPTLAEITNRLKDLNLSQEDKDIYTIKLHELSGKGEHDKANSLMEKLKKKSYGNDLCTQYDDACNLISKYNLTEEQKSDAYQSLCDKVHMHFNSYGTDLFISTKKDIKDFLIETKNLSRANEAASKIIFDTYKGIRRPISSDTARAINIVNVCTNRHNNLAELQKLCTQNNPASLGPHEKSLRKALLTISEEFTQRGYVQLPVTVQEQ